MDLTDKVKAKIDAMSYEDMLRDWRHAPLGAELFQGESGEYFTIAMAEKRKEVSGGDHVAASKRIGW